MNIGSIIVACIVILIVVLDVRYLLRSSSGGCSDCNGSCSSCGPTCKWTEDIQKAKRELI